MAKDSSGRQSQLRQLMAQLLVIVLSNLIKLLYHPMPTAMEV
jgi:hypothetical protein